ncbi:MAG TPA: ferric reductase-like transmembrane domain-containing protein [Acidimicrobiales bacterium]|nr:ferric reductase-like transmembrane domain-containing protein [Acidimicrobiales bacterium]
MSALTSPYLWYSTRATGMVTMGLFTLVVVLGTFVANRVGGDRFGRFEINELHRSVSMVAIVFLAIHVITTVADSYVPTGVLSVVVPFTSAYRRVAVGVGAVSLDLLLAVWISSLLKARIANTSWRFIHWFSWMAFATALVHAYLTGTDARHGWGLALLVLCAASGLAAALWRFLARPTRAAGRTALSPLTANATLAPRAQGAPPSRPNAVAASRGASRPTSRPLGSGSRSHSNPPSTYTHDAERPFKRRPRP